MARGGQFFLDGHGVVVAQIHRNDGVPPVEQELRAAPTDLSECARDQNGVDSHDASPIHQPAGDLGDRRADSGGHVNRE
ncbi:hypothetical protein I550_2486 [Mycobacterium intracellulare 1956]|uniref:Uncharacterized protein n=1 Tax=Mycobacterium intracellulare 1956 TaxID=1299331 RepID=X8CV66_MYCIT|nr:hypothetical protein I550_2486 [Mycobacterium intracellulare 1956]